jgi:hypothetical protein
MIRTASTKKGEILLNKREKKNGKKKPDVFFFLTSESGHDTHGLDKKR